MSKKKCLDELKMDKKYLICEKEFWRKIRSFRTEKISMLINEIKDIKENGNDWKYKLQVIEKVFRIVKGVNKSICDYNGKEKDIVYIISGKERIVKNTATMMVLFFTKSGEVGSCDYLTLELLSDGTGDIYNCPKSSLFLYINKIFNKSIEEVKSYFIQDNLWPNSHDIRWSLQGSKNASGNSISGAFGIALWKLLREPKLNLDKIAITARADERGLFYPVDGISEKLQGACLKLVPYIVVAKDQSIHKRFLGLEKTPRFLLAGNLREAVEEIKNRSSIVSVNRRQFIVNSIALLSSGTFSFFYFKNSFEKEALKIIAQMEWLVQGGKYKNVLKILTSNKIRLEECLNKDYRAKLYWLLARCYQMTSALKMSNLKIVNNYFNKAFNLAEGREKDEIFLGKAIASRQHGKLEDAKNIFEEYIKNSDPLISSIALNQMGLLWTGLCDYKEAEKSFKKADRKIKNLRAHDNMKTKGLLLKNKQALSSTYYQLGNIEKAKEVALCCLKESCKSTYFKESEINSLGTLARCFAINDSKKSIMFTDIVTSEWEKNGYFRGVIAMASIKGRTMALSKPGTFSHNEIVQQKDIIVKNLFDINIEKYYCDEITDILSILKDRHKI